MKKYVLLLTSVVLLTGCSCEYTLDVQSNSITEKLSIKETKETINNNIIQTIVADYDIFNCTSINDLKCKKAAFENEKDYYVKNYLAKKTNTELIKIVNSYQDDVKYGEILLQQRNDDENNYGVSYTNNISISNIDNSLLSAIADNYEIKEVDNYIYIKINSLNKKFIDEIDTAKLIINIPFKVTDSNADLINSNSYVWNYIKGEDINISLTADTNKIVSTTDNNGNTNTNTDANDFNTVLIIIIAVAISLSGLLVFIIINRKSKKNNKI